MGTASLRTLPARVVRVAVAVISAGGVAGMIVSSIADRGNAALTFGLVAAAAATCLIAVSAVAPPHPRAQTATMKDSTKDESPQPLSEQDAHDIETRIAALVDQGADEASLRALVRLVRQKSAPH